MLNVQLQTYHFIEYRRKVNVLKNKRIGHIWNLKKHLTRVKNISAKLLIYTKMLRIQKSYHPEKQEDKNIWI